jgi:hypothetical protein
MPHAGITAVKSLSLHEALGTRESVRTATHDRSPHGSPALSRRLNLADALSRLTLSGDRCRHASNASLRERLFTENFPACGVASAGWCARSVIVHTSHELPKEPR